MLEPLREGWTATRFLGDIGDTRAVDPLILALNDEYDCVRFDTALSP